jgi:predicted MFS family arabinose efflux permease
MSLEERAIPGPRHLQRSRRCPFPKGVALAQRGRGDSPSQAGRIRARMSALRTPWLAISTLAGVLGLRMLGLFLLLPVLALHARSFPDATPTLAGLALGVYGATQAVLQVPAGWLSDRWGRRPVILLGLGIFAIGSLVAANADTLWMVVAGRALQGAGAISAAATALAADLTAPAQRTRAMAVIGITIGASFALSLVLGPLLAGTLGVPGLFQLTAGLALLGAVLVALLIPTPPAPEPRLAAEAPASGLGPVYGGVFLIHALLTAQFIAVPVALADHAGLPLAEHWRVYLPALGASLLLTLPLIGWEERRGGPWSGHVALGLLALGLGGAALAGGSTWGLGLAMAAFFGGFNFLEASYPARVAAAASPAQRGQAMGTYATLQFLGAFAGGLGGGAMLGFGGTTLVLVTGVVGLGLAALLILRGGSPGAPQGA